MITNTKFSTINPAYYAYRQPAFGQQDQGGEVFQPSGEINNEIQEIIRAYKKTEPGNNLLRSDSVFSLKKVKNETTAYINDRRRDLLGVDMDNDYAPYELFVAMGKAGLAEEETKTLASIIYVLANEALDKNKGNPINADKAFLAGYALMNIAHTMDAINSIPNGSVTIH